MTDGPVADYSGFCDLPFMVISEAGFIKELKGH
jgi:hypothetical protein